MGGQPVEPWTPLGELVALMEADSLDELYRRLVLWPTVRRNSWDTFEAWCLFHKHHEHDQEGAATTAVLLVTDARWGSASGRLMAQIAASGLVPADHLDVLAETFLAAGKHVYWQTPDEWWGGAEIVIALDGDDGPEALDDCPAEEDERPAVAPREIRPPLRRWAADRLVRAEPARWAGTVARAKQLDSRAAAGVMRGVLDAVVFLNPEGRRIVLDVAAAWPNKGVREAGAELAAGNVRIDRLSADRFDAAQSRTNDEPVARRRQPSLF